MEFASIFANVSLSRPEIRKNQSADRSGTITEIFSGITEISHILLSTGNKCKYWLEKIGKTLFICIDKRL